MCFCCVCFILCELLLLCVHFRIVFVLCDVVCVCVYVWVCIMCDFVCVVNVNVCCWCGMWCVLLWLVAWMLCWLCLLVWCCGVVCVFVDVLCVWMYVFIVCDLGVMCVYECVVVVGVLLVVFVVMLWCVIVLCVCLNCHMIGWCYIVQHACDVIDIMWLMSCLIHILWMCGWVGVWSDLLVCLDCVGIVCVLVWVCWCVLWCCWCFFFKKCGLLMHMFM